MPLPPEIARRLEGTNWSPCGPGMEIELQREVKKNPKHPLHKVKAFSVARCSGTDDVLFVLRDHEFLLASVHLTYNEEKKPEAPEATFYASWDEWLEKGISP